MTLRVVVAGAGGFIGSALCAQLRRDGIEVVELVRGESPEAVIADAARATPPSSVVNTAGCFGRRGESLSQLAEINALLPLQLAESCRRHGIPRLLHLDTVLPAMLDAYASTKAMGARLLELASGHPGGPAITRVRCHHIYGPTDTGTLFPNWLVRELLREAPEIALTEGQQERDFLYLDDAIGALQLLLAAPGELGPEIELGSGTALSLRQFAERARQLSGSRSRLCFGARPSRPGEPARLVASTEPLQALGWQPQVGLDQGLLQLIEHQRHLPCAS